MTTLIATPQPATALLPPSMLLQVTGAPAVPAGAYASNFATADGWANGGSATLTPNQTVSGVTPKTLQIQGPATLADATAQRALTGLTAGTKYRYKASIAISRGEVQLVARDTASGTVLASTSFVTYSSPTNKTVNPSIDFTASAANVTIQIVIHQTTVFSGSTANVYAYNVSVSPLGTWQGTTIYRTDANGTDVVVREDPAGQDTVGGTMTVTDWEAALCGVVTYRVVDGNGVSTSTVTSHAEARRNFTTNPAGRTDTARWFASAGGGAAAVTQVAAGGPDGGSFIRATWSAAQTTGSGNAGLVYDLAGGAATIPVNPGEYLSGRVWIRTSSQQRMTMYIQYLSAAGLSQQSTNTVPIITVANKWTEVVLDQAVPAPAGVTKAHVLLYSIAGAGAAPWAAGDMLDATYLLTEKAQKAGAYFDGDTANLGAVRHGWLGTPNGSASIETAEQPALGAWLTLPATATPSAGAAGAPKAVNLQLVLGYEAAAETTGGLFQVIGRTDKIGNPGPLATRSGTLDVLEPDYPTAKAVRDLLQNGDTAMLRQPTFPGMDMYLVASRVSEAWQDPQTATRRWGVTLTVDEVVAP